MVSTQAESKVPCRRSGRYIADSDVDACRRACVRAYLAWCHPCLRPHALFLASGCSVHSMLTAWEGKSNPLARLEKRHAKGRRACRAYCMCRKRACVVRGLSGPGTLVAIRGSTGWQGRTWASFVPVPVPVPYTASFSLARVQCLLRGICAANVTTHSRLLTPKRSRLDDASTHVLHSCYSQYQAVHPSH